SHSERTLTSRKSAANVPNRQIAGNPVPEGVHYQTCRDNGEDDRFEAGQQPEQARGSSSGAKPNSRSAAARLIPCPASASSHERQGGGERAALGQRPGQQQRAPKLQRAFRQRQGSPRFPGPARPPCPRAPGAANQPWYGRGFHA